MRALTPQVWAEHHEDLGGLVLDHWPALTTAQLQAAGADFDALAEVVAAADGVTVDEGRRELLRLEVDERQLGSSEPGRGGSPRASLAQLRLGTGFSQDERDFVVAALEKLDRRLEKFPADATDLQISVKNRGDNDQSVTLEAWLPRLPHFAATSTEEDLRAALMDVRESMWRQIDDALGKRRPYQ